MQGKRTCARCQILQTVHCCWLLLVSLDTLSPTCLHVLPPFAAPLALTGTSVQCLPGQSPR